jgi:hypothetical protein
MLYASAPADFFFWPVGLYGFAFTCAVMTKLPMSEKQKQPMAATGVP